MLTPDFDAILGRLGRSGLDFVLIGGLAAIAHGVTSSTFDVDVCCEFNYENLARIESAFADVHPVHRMTPQKLPLEITRENAERFRNLYLHTDLGVIDFLGEVAGIGGYREVSSQSVEIELPAGSYRVLSIDALIRAKQTTNRLQDKIALRQLLAIKERQNANRH